MTTPNYYSLTINDGPCDVYDIAEAAELGLALGNALKYIIRAGRKAGNPATQDLTKAIRSIERQIEIIQRKEAQEFTKTVEAVAETFPPAPAEPSATEVALLGSIPPAVPEPEATEALTLAQRILQRREGLYKAEPPEASTEPPAWLSSLTTQVYPPKSLPPSAEEAEHCGLTVLLPGEAPPESTVLVVTPDGAGLSMPSENLTQFWEDPRGYYILNS